MNAIQVNKRQICQTCQYPQSTCVCAWVKPITPPLNIIILQHPKETKHAKNTVKLLNLGIKHVIVLCGEQPKDWQELAQQVKETPQNFCLFFPHDSSQALESVTSEQHKTGYFPVDKQVIFIDASWRKAQKIWHLNPWLQLCQSWHFAEPPANQYRIRQTRVPNSLSTLESVAYVLEFTHDVDCSALLALFNHMQHTQFLAHQNQDKNA